MSDFLLRFRVPLSAVHTLVLMVLAVLLVRTLVPQQAPLTKNSTPIELTLIQPDIQPEAPLASPQTPARTVPRISPSVAPRPAAQAAVGAAPEQQAEIVEVAAPVASPATIPASVNALTSAPAISAPPILPSPAVAVGREAEVAYVGKVRAYLQGVKRYPTGREASLQRPAGVVTIGFTLRRSGELAEAGVERSSGSLLLDNAALATVRRGVYPAFPDDAWAAKAQQRFSVELDFVPVN